MISRDAFLKKNCIDEKLLESSGFEWADLVNMHDDFQLKIPMYAEKLEQFIGEYLSPGPELISANGEAGM